MDEAYWDAVRSMRLSIADLLDELSPAEWDAASLCQGWRVRDVAAHVALVPRITTWQMMSVAPRAGFNPHRINTILAVRHGSTPPDQIITTLRDHAAGRGTARVLNSRDALFDVIVHSQDIAVPLGRDLPVPADFTRQGLQRVWDMGWPFNARRRLAGLTLSATDTDWTAGTGRQVSGTALSLLLLLTGRTSTAVGQLQGPGVARLSA